MPMPKASVDENDFLPAPEDDVRAAWKATVVKPVAIPHRKSSRRTTISGLVPFDFTLAIRKLRSEEGQRIHESYQSEGIHSLSNAPNSDAPLTLETMFD